MHEAFLHQGFSDFFFALTYPQGSREPVMFCDSCVVEPWVCPSTSLPPEDLTRGLLHAHVGSTTVLLLDPAFLPAFLGTLVVLCRTQRSSKTEVACVLYVGAEPILLNASDSTSNPSHYPSTTSAICAPHKCKRLYTSARSSLCCHSRGHSGLSGGVFYRYSYAWGSHGIESPGKEVDYWKTCLPILSGGQGPPSRKSAINRPKFYIVFKKRFGCKYKKSLGYTPKTSLLLVW